MRARIILTALAGVVGAVTAAQLVTSTTAEESGRKVEAIAVPADSSAGLPAGVEILAIGGREQLRAYRDIAGVWTICDGITRGVRPGMVVTSEYCLRRLEEELVIHARGVMACTPGLAGQGRDNQRAAAVSLAFNIGVRGFCRSTAARRFNAGNVRGACDAFLAWNKARVRGRLVVVRGLALRRQRERAVCLRDLP